MTYANMPAGFHCDPDYALIHTGEHCWNYNTAPGSYTESDTPTLLMGTYDADIAFFETMYAAGLVTGDSDYTYSKAVVYKGQTIPILLSEHKINYVAAAGCTTIILCRNQTNCDGKEVTDSPSSTILLTGSSGNGDDDTGPNASAPSDAAADMDPNGSEEPDIANNAVDPDANAPLDAAAEADPNGNI